MVFSVALFQFVRYLLYKTIAVDGVLDWAWTRQVIETRHKRLVDLREVREELRREMDAAAAANPAMDADL